MSTSPSKITVERLLKNISTEFDQLSKQLKVIARHVEAHRDQLGLEGIQEVASACGVQPSAVVRFAKHFGFSGFSEMQKVFRDVIAKQLSPGRNYQTRIREVIDADTVLSSVDIAHEFLRGSAAGTESLRQSLHGPSFSKAVELLFATDGIWLMGSRRSFAVATYLDYAFQHTEKRVHLVTGLGGTQMGQIRSMRKGDVLLAISFPPYADETLEVAQAAVERGVKLIAITDSRMSPLATLAQTTLLLQENVTFGFRSLTSTMGLAQSLFIALAYKLELDYAPHAQ